MPNEIIVSKIPDKKIIDLFNELAQTFGQQSRHFQMGELGFSDPPEALLKSRTATYSINDATYYARDSILTVRVQRNYANNPYLDVVSLTAQSGRSPAPTPEQMLQATAIIQKHGKMPAITGGQAGTDELGKLFEMELTKISDMHQELLRDALALKATFEQQHAERTERFLQEQDEVRARITQQEQESRAQIASEEEALALRKGEFDLSDHMRARRKQREEITEQVKTFLQQPKSDQGSARKLMLLIFVCLCASMASGLFAYESFQSFIAHVQPKAEVAQSSTISQLPKSSQFSDGSISSNDTPREAFPAESTTRSNSRTQTASASSSVKTAPTTDYILWSLAVRAFLSTAVSIGFLVYVLAFIRRSHDEDVRYHRDLQRYGMDINRASWVIETALEMTSKEDAQLPDKWVEGACYGLFQSNGSKEAEVGSLAALGAVMGLGPEVSVTPDGASFKIPPKAAKKAAKDAA